MDTTGIPSLTALLARSAPGLLHHYASPDGLIGVVKHKEIWASNIAYLNDLKEVGHAVDYAKGAIDNKLRRGGLDDTQIAVLNGMQKWAGTAAKRYYVASFSEDGNLLSQWRAYCPPGGGYSVGVPSAQLRCMANEQGFTLAPCVYDHILQSNIVNELVDHHLAAGTVRMRADPGSKESLQWACWSFAQHLTQIACVLKHSAFSEEREWRLISQTIQEPHPQLDFRASPSRVIPFFHFKLSSAAHPNLAAHDGSTFTVIAGPTSERDLAAMATQFLLATHLPGAAFGASEIPYRTW